MVRTYPPTTGPPSACACRATWATKTPNIFPESSSQAAGTITVKAAVLGTEAFEAERRDDSRRRKRQNSRGGLWNCEKIDDSQDCQMSNGCWCASRSLVPL